MKSVFRWPMAAVAMATMTCSVANSASAVELKVGDPSPDFEMVGTDGKTYKLADFKGKRPVVIAWYPKAFTGG